MKIEIINQQKLKRINLKVLSACLKKTQAFFDPSPNLSKRKNPVKLSILLCDNTFIKKLNKKYFKSSNATDVISFPLSDKFEPDYLGEVVVSVEKAVQVSRKLSCDWKKELTLYIIHGILHLMGYDDRRKKQRSIMEAKQQQILEKIWET